MEVGRSVGSVAGRDLQTRGGEGGAIGWELWVLHRPLRGAAVGGWAHVALHGEPGRGARWGGRGVGGRV